MSSIGKIIIITTEPFPIGLAATNRILCYCKGFIENGFSPEVFVIKPSESKYNTYNTLASGIFEDIKFIYHGGTTVRSSSFLMRRINDLKAFLITLKELLKTFRKKESHFAIFYGNYPLAEIICTLVFRLIKKKLYKEESENPNTYFNNRISFRNSILKWIYIGKLYKSYSAVFVMTDALREFFVPTYLNDKKVLIVPQTVDESRFELTTSQNGIQGSKRYIAFVGSLNQKKDGVLTLVKAFNLIHSKYEDIFLIIAGDGSSSDKNALTNLIHAHNLDNRVKFMGRISSQRVPSFLVNAHVLVSCRPKSFQSEFGFPTKIVEYLASGKPIVTTSTGELEKFLEDRENCFIANYDAPELIANKISEVLDNYEFALKTAQRGKELVKVKFSKQIQTQKIIDFHFGNT